MQDLGQYYVRVDSVFDTHGEPERVGQFVKENLRQKLAEKITADHKKEDLNFGITKMSISGYFFTEEQLGRVIENVRLSSGGSC